MKTNNIFTVVLLAAMSTACTGNKDLNSGLNLANLDSTYQAGTDFYMYATGGWQKANPLTAEYSRYGSFDVLRENNIGDVLAISILVVVIFAINEHNDISILLDGAGFAEV